MKTQLYRIRMSRAKPFTHQGEPQSPGSPEYPVLAELVQFHFEDIGLQTEMIELDWASIGAAGRGREAYFIHPVQNTPIRPGNVALTNTFLEEGSSSLRKGRAIMAMRAMR